jgi:hypothetical protein
MKYWGYLVAKLSVAFAMLYGVGWIIASKFPLKPFSQGGTVIPYFQHTLANFVLGLFAVGILWLVIWDQRYRCRTCVRRLRMPIQTGSWNHVLFGAPKTEYICLYGHGTLKVAELQITGRQEPDWEPHADIWKELFSLEETKK